MTDNTKVGLLKIRLQRETRDIFKFSNVYFNDRLSFMFNLTYKLIVNL